MKRLLFSVVLLLIPFAGGVAVAATSGSSVPAASWSEGVNPTVKKKLADARQLIANEQYEEAIEQLECVLEIEPDNEDALFLKEACDAAIEEIYGEAREAYEEACSRGSKSAFLEFLRLYPDCPYADEAKAQMADIDAWEKAQNSNTVESYRLYLNSTASPIYATEAQKKMEALLAEEEWERCKYATDEASFNNFISRHPTSPRVSQARYRLNLIKGENNYKQGNETLAYNYLKEASDFESLTGEPARIFKELQEKRTFEEVSKSNDPSRVKNYLNTLPVTSPFYTPASNQYALMLANSLNAYSTDANYDEALAYAKDEATKTTVKGYIASVKKERDVIDHERRVAARKNWWKGRFLFGWNIFHFDAFDESVSAGTGLRFKFGRWSDFLNVAFGAEYSAVMNLNHADDNFFQDMKVRMASHQVEVPVGVKLNLFKVGGSAKFYIGCAASIGFKIGEGEDFKGCVNKRNLAIEPQLGFQKRHLDFGFYYKRYLDNDNSFLSDEPSYLYIPDGMKHRVGFNLTCYF